MAVPRPQILRYTDWLARERGLRFDATTNEGYDALWRWSVTDLEAFWRSIWEFYGLQSPTPFTQVLADDRMPGARWFDGAQLNYAQQVFRHADAAHAAGHPAIVFQDERLRDCASLLEWSWPKLRRQVASLAAHYRQLGIVRGDRICAFMPNTPQAVVAFLAAASLGAVWSVCSPDMGPVAVLDRFRQIEPTLLVGCDGYVHGGNTHDRLALLQDLVKALPTLKHVLLWRNLGDALPAGWHDFDALLCGDAPLQVDPLPFDHPLWIVYSSGTTGLPKAIVHGHGGVVLEHLKFMGLHNDLGPSAEGGDRFHWYSATGWIMWNCQLAGLLNGTTICLYDGSPAGRSGQPDWNTLWRFVADAKATFFGAGAAFFASCMKAGIEPARLPGLARLRALGSTGSPLSADVYRWAAQHLPRVADRPMWLTSLSGGTDFAGAFVAGLPTLPVVEGEMQCRCLGAAVEAWSEPDPATGRGQALVDEVGELVCTRPMPSMPLYFWGDADGQRYRESYFDMYPEGNGRPAVWRHGDWLRITPRGGAIIYGRSDATINRHGIRMGTAELYRAVEALPEVLDSLVVDLEYLGRESWMPLFVVLREGRVLDEALVARLKQEIRSALSARHVPNEIFQVDAIPRTLSGKKMELPVKKLLMGTPAEQVFKLDAMANAGSVAWFAEFARRRNAS